MIIGGQVAAVLIVVLLVLGGAAWALAGWVTQPSSTSAALAGVALSGSADGWAVGAGGVVLHTTDGGSAWVAQTSGVAADLASVTFADADDGWAVGAGGVVLHTTDGGSAWVAQTSGVAADLASVTFADADDGWAVGAGGVVLHTTDGGSAWVAQTSGVAADLASVTFADADDGWAVGAGGVVLHTTDGGSAWVAQTSGVAADLASVTFADADDGWAVGAGGVVLHTTDGGSAWVAQTSGVAADLASVTFADADDGWAVGAGGVVLHTTDGGSAWAPQTAPAGTSGLAAVAAVSPRRATAVGAQGAICATVSGGETDTTPPVTVATGLQADAHSGWRNSAATVSFAATDAGSGVDATYYSIDGGTARTYATAFGISAAGSHTVAYWSVDGAGNVEARRTGYVNIDKGRPTCVAVSRIDTKRDSTVSFVFRVNDPAPSCGKADVKIVIKRGAKVLQTIRFAALRVNVRHTYSESLHLSYGAYTWVVTATDLAGNAQRRAGSNALRIVLWPIHTRGDVQRCLVHLKYLPPDAVTGRLDYRTEQALMAFQAWTGLVRDGIDGAKTRNALEMAHAPRPRPESASGHYAEVFRSLGVLLAVNDGTLVRVVHCSTGRPSLPTPAGRFHIFLKSPDWWSTAYGDWMPFASFFSGGDAIHGYPDVPAYPASHGCCRISMPEAPWVYTFMYYGATVFVY